MTDDEIVEFAHSIGFRSGDQARIMAIARKNGIAGNDCLTDYELLSIRGDTTREGQRTLRQRGSSIYFVNVENNDEVFNVGTWPTPDDAALALAKLIMVMQ